MIHQWFSWGFPWFFPWPWQIAISAEELEWVKGLDSYAVAGQVAQRVQTLQDRLGWAAGENRHGTNGGNFVGNFGWIVQLELMIFIYIYNYIYIYVYLYFCFLLF